MNNPLLFLDIESTSLDWSNAEILTARFELYDGNTLINEYDFHSQVDNWSEEASKIHKITYKTMLTYPPKALALKNLLGFLNSLSAFDICLFCNPNNFGSVYHYDMACIQFTLMNFLCVDRIEDQPFKPQNIINVYQLAKDAYMNGYFNPIKNESGRNSFSQENIYLALFNKNYDAHNAKTDVAAMRRIYLELNKRIENKLKNQMELI